MWFKDIFKCVCNFSQYMLFNLLIKTPSMKSNFFKSGFNSMKGNGECILVPWLQVNERVRWWSSVRWLKLLLVTAGVEDNCGVHGEGQAQGKGGRRRPAVLHSCQELWIKSTYNCTKWKRHTRNASLPRRGTHQAYYSEDMWGLGKWKWRSEIKEKS